MSESYYKTTLSLAGLNSAANTASAPRQPESSATPTSTPPSTTTSSTSTYGVRGFGGSKVFANPPMPVQKDEVPRTMNDFRNFESLRPSSTTPPPISNPTQSFSGSYTKKGFTSFGGAGGTSPNLTATSLHHPPSISAAAADNNQPHRSSTPTQYASSNNSNNTAYATSTRYKGFGVFNPDGPKSLSSSPNTQRFNAFGGVRNNLPPPATYDSHVPTIHSQPPTPKLSPSLTNEAIDPLFPSSIFSKVDPTVSASKSANTTSLFSKLPSPATSNDPPSASIALSANDGTSAFTRRKSFEVSGSNSINFTTNISRTTASTAPQINLSTSPNRVNMEYSPTYEAARQLMDQGLSTQMRQFLSSIPRLQQIAREQRREHILPEKLLRSYTLHFPLGEGATGFVAYGTRNSDSLSVAIKCTFKDRLVPGGWKRDNQLGIVPSEVFIMKRLEHENIVRFYELFEDELFVYIVMEAVKHISFPHHHHHHHHQHKRPGSTAGSNSPRPFTNTPPTLPNTLSLSLSSIPNLNSPILSSTASSESSLAVPLTTTNLTSPTFAVPHPHDISSPSFPLLVKLNSKVDLTKLMLGDSSSGGETGSEDDYTSSGTEEGEEEGVDEAMAIVSGASGSFEEPIISGKGFIVGDSDTDDKPDVQHPKKKKYQLRGRAGSHSEDALLSTSAVGGEIGLGLMQRKGKGSTTSLVKLSVSAISGGFRAPIGSLGDKTPTASGIVTLASPTTATQHHNHRGFKKRAVSKDLFDYIEQEPRMGEKVARMIFRQIAEAVKYLHSKGFVHRDIKDENVIIDDSMRVKLIDFGASATIPSSRAEYFTSFDGTLAYAPPECVALNDMTPIDPYRGPEQDVWSLGMLLFILVETKPPYSKTASREERSVRPVFSAGRSDQVQDLVFKMMDPNVETRISMQGVCDHEWFSGVKV
ncbi:hypothetical protein HDU79_006661 [Rhizoclosmatium sp. JEL0117]|nr:hypothetical protein HDU79_006661 [Rhizoclosmatium sp. JEL0117]